MALILALGGNQLIETVILIAVSTARTMAGAAPAKHIPDFIKGIAQILKVPSIAVLALQLFQPAAHRDRSCNQS